MQGVKRLSLGVVLLALASAVLLLSDTSGRRRQERQVKRLAIVQHASQPIIDEGVRGMMEALAAAGYVDGQTLSVRRYNAEGDMPTANTIAAEVVGGDFDLILTATTPSLQTVANANRDGRKLHVFGLVTDPLISGVGITGRAPDQHPPWMVGYGTMQPVRETFALARQLLPDLERVGEVWNSAEVNSEAQTTLAREVCREMGIELLEANAESSAAVQEAAGSLVARGVQAIWVPGDVTVLSAIGSVVGAARGAGIPVFSSIPGNADRGVLLEVGANYHEVGRIAGELAVRVLRGTAPSEIGVVNVMPERIVVNRAALAGLHEPWRIPEEVAARAGVILDAAGAVEKGAEAPAPTAASEGARLARLWNLDLLEYVSLFDVDDAERGIRAGLAEAGLVEGRDFRMKVRNAQGEMPTLSALVDAAITEGTDLLLTLSTPTLQAAMQRGGELPIVFTFVADGVAAGAGRSNDDHRPNVTGVPTAAAVGEMLPLIRQLLPDAKRLGTLFAPAESNSEFYKEEAEHMAPEHGFELVAVAVNSTAETSDAALALLSHGVDAIAQIPGNLTSSAFTSIAQPAIRAGVPVFGFLTSDFDNGAVIVVARDYFDGGREAGLMAARIMRGASPSSIPFEPLRTARLMIDLGAARRVGLAVPDDLVRRAVRVVGDE
jgi:ABC-type uncharacterized transport system substrate-binding protein